MVSGGEELGTRRGRRAGRKQLSWRVLLRLSGEEEVEGGLERIRKRVGMQSLSVWRVWSTREGVWEEVVEEGREEEMDREELRPELERR